MPSYLRWEKYSWRIRSLVLIFVFLWGIFGPSIKSVENSIALVYLVGIAAFCNILLWFILRRCYDRAFSYAILCVDVLIAYYVIYLTGGIDSPLPIVFFMPIVSSAMLFGAVGFSVVLLAIAVLYGLAVTAVSDLSRAEQMVFLARVFLLGLTALLAKYIAQEEKQRTYELSSLRKVSRSIAAITELHTTLKELLAAIANILHAEKALIMLYDASSDMLVAQEPAFGLSGEKVTVARLPRGKGISWEVFSSGEPILVHDVFREPRIAKELIAAHAAKTLLSVPLKVKQEVMGVIDVINKTDGTLFSKRDCDLLELLAGEAALILEHARLLRAVKQEKGTLDAILHSLRGGVVVTDPQGKIILANHWAERLLSISEAQSLGKPLEQVLDDPAFLKLLDRVHRGEKEFTDEIIIKSPADLALRIDSCPVVDELGDPDTIGKGNALGQVTIFTDISDLKNLDRLKTEFVSSVSHELRTPLTSIKAYTATLLRGHDFDRQTQSGFLTVINDQCDRLTRLINDMLDIASLEKGEAIKVNFFPVDLRDLVERVVRSEKALTEKHEFQIEIPESAQTLEVDENQMERILTNLVNNAVKYSPNGGTITVASRDSQDAILISVKDEGIGIPAHRQDAIFNKFYQLDGRHTRRVGGSGLGLYVVKHLVESHGGAIWVESRVGEGSTFFVKLPRRRTP